MSPCFFLIDDFVTPLAQAWNWIPEIPYATYPFLQWTCSHSWLHWRWQMPGVSRTQMIWLQLCKWPNDGTRVLCTRMASSNAFCVVTTCWRMNTRLQSSCDLGSPRQSWLTLSHLATPMKWRNYSFECTRWAKRSPSFTLSRVIMTFREQRSHTSSRQSWIVGSLMRA